jgi:hypothetical protein
MTTPTISPSGASTTARKDAITVLGISAPGKDHFTRLWPTAKDGSPSGFLLVVLPIRFVALAMLWATSTPRRLVLPVTVAVVLVVGLLLARHGHGLHWAALFTGGR